MYTPMAAVALLPLTAFAGFLAEAVAGLFGSGVGVAVLVAAMVAIGWWAASIAIANASVPATSGWRRFLPHAVTFTVIAAGAVEIISGSRAPDPVLVLWWAAFCWLFVFAAHVRERWSPARTVLWWSGPVATVLVIAVVWTSGFFAFRFDRSVDDLDAYVARLDQGERFRAGVEVGWFTIEARGQLRGCDHAFRITGWHENDDRWIAYCPNSTPSGTGIARLADSWFDYPG
jgi:hypothetical protein